MRSDRVEGSSLGFVDFYIDLAAIHFDFMGNRGAGRRHRKMFARANVEFRSVPGTGDLETFELAVAQCPPVMCANIVQRVKISVGMKQRDQLVLDFDQRFTGVGNFGHFGNFDPGGHVVKGRRQKAEG